MLDFQWENDELEVVFKIGSKPEFELTDITKVKVNKMVHDVTEKDVQEEVDRSQNAMEIGKMWIPKLIKILK